MSSTKKSSYIKKDSINSGISTNSAHSNNLNKKNQCLYKREILSSLIRLPTKIKQDGVIKSYNIENIQREKKKYNTRPITVNLNKSINKQNIISPYKSNQDNNYNNNNNDFNTSYSIQQKTKIDILINNLYDLFHQIQLLFLNGKNCINECNDWIEIFNSNIEFIVEMCNANEYLPLINNSLNLLFFTIIIIYDICNQNKFYLFNDDMKNVFEIYLLLSENIFERCKNPNKVNLQIQSNTISIANKDLNSFLNQLILNYHQINSNISRELTTLFKRLRRINTNDIYDFYQTKIKQYELNYQNTNIHNLNNNSINNTQNINNKINITQNINNNYYNNYQKNYQNSNNEDSYMNIYNYKNKYYSSNTSNSMPIPKNYSSKIINGPGNVLTTDINYIGAALTNSGVIFPFKKTSAMRQREKNDRIRSISSNMNTTYSNDNNLDYFNQNNNNYIHNNNYSNNTSPNYHNNNFEYFDNKYNIFESNNSNFNNYLINNYNINNEYNQRNLNSYSNQNTIKYYDYNTKNSNKNYYNLNYNNFNNRNIGNINLNYNSIQQNQNYNQRQNIININTPLIPFSPDKQFTLVLDLDDTLSYVSKDTNKIYLRPGLREFLQSLHSYYELIVFTSENKEYADQIIDFIEIEQKFFDYRLYKQNSNYSNEKNIKDIKKLGRDFKRTIIIDDKDENVELNNAIIIKSFFVNNNYHNLNDSVLYDLIGILIKIAKEEPNDIRNSLRRYRSEINKQIIK